MKITSFNPLIIVRDLEPTVRLFEEMGFERRHMKTGIGDNENTDIRMKDANGFCVDVAQSDGEWTMIRMNVDNLDAAIEFLTEHGFRKPRHDSASKKVDTGSSKYTMMVAPSGYIVTISEHIKERN